MTTEPDARRRPHARIAFFVVVIGLGAGIAAVLLAGGAARRVSTTASRTVTAAVIAPAFANGRGLVDVTIPGPGRALAIPRSFLGLSTEYWTLPVDEQHTRLYKRVLTMLHVPGDGRFILRIGGDSSDHAVFDPTARRLPPWAFAVTPSLVARTAAIVRQLDLRVIVDLNTFTTDAQVAADWAHAAEAGFPAGSLLGFEVGNEPDLYNRAAWVAQLHNTGFDLSRLPAAITPASNASDYLRFADALQLATPGVPLLAPALAIPNTDLNWISTLLASPHPGLRAITAHRYPYSACAPPGTPTWPTVDKLLSDAASVEMRQTIEPAVRLGRESGVPVRLTEINSVTCGGLRGVSNAFVTALWAPDALFELVRSGVDGVNLHARVFSINAPFFFTEHGLRAQPLLYGMIVFARMLGPHSRLLPVLVHRSRSLNIKVWAVREGANTLNVLLINKGGKPATIDLHLPSTATASVQRLLAPSAASVSHVTWANQRLDDSVTWRGKALKESIRPTKDGYTLTLRRQSAALLSVAVARGS